MQGSWRAVADRTKAHKASTAEDRLTEAAWHIFALAKLRQYGDAARELESLGPLDSSKSDGEHWDNHEQSVCELCLMQLTGYSGDAGRALHVPFALRWLQAQLPLLMGRRQEGAMQLYNLLDFCQRQQNNLSTGATGPQRTTHAKIDGRLPDRPQHTACRSVGGTDVAEPARDGDSSADQQPHQVSQHAIEAHNYRTPLLRLNAIVDSGIL